MSAPRGLRALVTGASSGIGEAIARQLAAGGADLVLTARREDRLQELATRLRAAHGVQIDVVPLDLAAPGATTALAEAARAEGRPVHILINNAGFGFYDAFEAVSWENHQKVIQLNVVAALELTWRLIPHMRALGTPCYILNVASIAAFQPAPFYSVYGPTKSFLRDFSESLDYELRDTPIRVTCLCPGGTWTEFADAAGIEVPKAAVWAMQSADACASEGLRALFRGRRLIVSGWPNKLLIVLLRLIPRRLMPWLSHRTLGDPKPARPG